MLVAKGQRGSKIPIPSIERNYHRYMYFKIWQKLLQGNKIIRKQFPVFYSKNKHIFEKKQRIADKNPNKLMKIYNGDKFDKWVEVHNDSKNKYINSIVCFRERDDNFYFGVIKSFVSDSIVEIERGSLRKQNNSNLFLYDLLNFTSNVEVNRIIGYFSTITFYGRQWIIPLVHKITKHN